MSTISEANYRSAEYCTQIFKKLKKHYGIPAPPLHHKSVEQLTMAVILSAQCTDERVNIVTKDLFKKCPDMISLNQIPQKKLEKIIYSTGFYKNKASNLKKLASLLVKKYNAKIPPNFETLITLPGIGRKTANVIMAVSFDRTPGIVVDTHVRRISQLLKLTSQKTPEKIEQDLMLFVPKKYWRDLPLYLIFLGREYCKARRPDCPKCILNDICPSAIL